MSREKTHIWRHNKPFKGNTMKQRRSAPSRPQSIHHRIIHFLLQTSRAVNPEAWGPLDFAKRNRTTGNQEVLPGPSKYLCFRGYMTFNIMRIIYSYLWMKLKSMAITNPGNSTSQEQRLFSVISLYFFCCFFFSSVVPWISALKKTKNSSHKQKSSAKGLVIIRSTCK